MWNWIDLIFEKPRTEIRIVRDCDHRHALHIAFLKNPPKSVRGALLTSENPEILLEQLRAVRDLLRGVRLVIHAAERAPLSARALGAWLHALAAECPGLEVVVVVEAGVDIHDALEAARRRGCAIAGL